MAEISGSRLHLRILATSDLHAHILAWDDLTNQPAPERGLAQVARLIAQTRAEVQGSLLLDNGDFLNGSPLADHVAETRELTVMAPHPMIAAMNKLGYDAATLGNHEFSNGVPYLRRALSHAKFPILASNLDKLTSAGWRQFLPRYVLLPRDLADQNGDFHRVMVGIVGVLPPQTTLWERRHLEGRIQARDILTSIRDLLPKVRKAGADIIVALSHSGLGTETGGEGSENLSCALAGLDGIDAVVAGHTHQVYPSPTDSHPPPEPDQPLAKMAPLVMPGFFGSHLGVIDLTLEKLKTGWQVVAHKVSARAISERRGVNGEMTALVSPDPDIEALARPDTNDMLIRAAQPVGRTVAALHSYFALIGHSPVDTLLAEAQIANMAGLLVGRPEASLPMLVSVAPFKAGGRGGPANFIDIPPGPLNSRNIADLYIHPNSAVALRVKGQDLADWLERSVSLFNQIPMGSKDAPLVDPSFPAFNFDMIHGLSFQINLTKPPRFDALGRVANPDARRIGELRLNGQEISPDQPFVLVTNSYRASGGAGFAGTAPANIVMEDSRPLRRILQDYVVKQGAVRSPSKSNWGFVAMPGTTVTFDSGPGALAHGADISGLTCLGQQPTGFRRFRLAL